MRYTTRYDLIFAEDPVWRLLRHFYFWALVFLYHFLRIAIFYPADKLLHFLPAIIQMAFFWGVIANMIICYPIMYFLIPRYLAKKRYGLFSLLVVIFTAVVFILSAIYNFYVTRFLVQAIGIQESDLLAFVKNAAAIRFFGNLPLIFGSFLSLRTLKHWYLEQAKNEMLVKENAKAELQLLKAQIHPHFLFNTLNNIYSFALTGSPVASMLVSKLSGMLRYMVEECNGPRVQLEKELGLLQDYIDLEKVRYGNRLEIVLNIQGDLPNRSVAPLLMIPFVENSFKHGTSKMLEGPWIKMNIVVDDDSLLFELKNGRPRQNSSNGKKGIGLNNVKKRLELLYPKRYALNIEDAPGMFSVRLQIPVSTDHVKNNAFPPGTIDLHPNIKAYAAQ